MGDIIIVGDWVVDEYWYLVRQHSEISSHTGFVHYRSTSKPTERILDLCSAGHVARVLFDLRTESENKNCRIWGIGDWNVDDTEHLLHLIHANGENKCKASQANFTLSSQLCDSPPEDIKLIPLHKDRQTTRVVRLYHSTGTGIEQLSRIDWEVPPDESSQDEYEKCLKQLPKKEEVSSIVIHDLCKGAVTEKLINKLLKFNQAKWYVRTKSKNAPWLKKIKDKIALYLVGPEVAEPGNPWGSWLHETNISLQSYTYLQKTIGKTTVVLSDNREVIGRIKNKDDKCVTAKAPLPIDVSTQVGWPTALFATLVHSMHNNNSLTKEELEKILLKAHECAVVPVPIASGRKTLISNKPAIDISDWSAKDHEWDHAMEKMGIIKPQGSCKNEPRLEIWRGSSDLPGYVACIKEKRERIIQIGKQLRAFIQSNDPARSLSILLQADPGSGKTYLARLLAKKLNFSLLSFDITQMLHRDDLLDLFDAVATEQANNPGSRVLVIVDEINAHLDASPVYSSFLAPLEQGIYVRRGRVFSLRPCVWIFAGTDPEKSRKAKSEKISDFDQRLTSTVKLDFKSILETASDDQEREDVRLKAKLEQVYLGATLIKERYPDAKKVGVSVLEKFYNFQPESIPARKIRKIVEGLHNVTHGIITIRNMPGDNQKTDRHLIDLIGNA